MTNSKNDGKIQVRIAKTEDFFDLNLCAKEFIDFIDDFKKNFIDKRFFVLTGDYEGVLAGILVAEDKSKKIDSIERIVPSLYLHLIYVNPKYRKKGIGKVLLEKLIELQKKKRTAFIYIKLPEKYKKGIRFFQSQGFIVLNKHKNRVLMILHLWDDFGVCDCQIIGEDFDSLVY